MTWRNPVYNRLGTIDCEIEIAPDLWVPTTVDPTDTKARFDAAALNAEIRAAGGIASAPEKSIEEWQFEVLFERGRLLYLTDFIVAGDHPLDSAEVRAWRQALRDVTAQEGFPSNVIWPPVPEAVLPFINSGEL